MKAFFFQEFKNLWAYRSDFWIGFLASSLGHIFISYFLWFAIYSSTFEQTGATLIGGRSFSEMLLYILLSVFIMKATFGQSINFMAQDIYEGPLNKYLLLPISYLSLKLTAQMAHTFLYSLQLVLALCLFSLLTLFTPLKWPQEIVINSMTLISLPIFIIMGSILYFSLATWFELVAFWADSVWTLVNMLRWISFLLSGYFLPLNLFPSWVIQIQQFLPFRYFLDIPLQILLGKFPPEQILPSFLIGCVWMLITAVITQIIWRRGLLQYSGVGI